MPKKIEMSSYEMEMAYTGLKDLLSKCGSNPFINRESIEALMEKLREAHNASN